MNSYAVDTSAWVSFFYRGRFEKIVQGLINSNSKIVSCNEQLSEFKDIHAKHATIAKMLPGNVSVYADALLATAYFIEVKKRYALIPDYKDNYLVDLAHQSKSILVTNDKHFTILKKLQRPKIKVITLKEFYSEVGI